MFPHRIAVKDMNPHLVCTLCGGYFIDATTIIECLHSFCKSCIVKHLASSKYCPTCDVQVHKTRPLENVRPDHILQAIVYKLVPGLYQNEMKCRREFYRKHQEDVPVSSEAKGEISEECGIFFPEESIMLSLEYNSENSESCQISCSRRYLQCPAAITIVHLQKLIRSKFGLTPDCKVHFFCTNVLLPEFLTLLDIAYIFKWRRKTVLHLSYHILESKSQIVEPKKEVTEEPTHCEKIADSTKVEKPIISETASVEMVKPEENWQEVQLQISENGVVSAAAPSSSTSQENIVNEINFEAKSEGPKSIVSNDDQKSQGNANKLEVGVKMNHVESAPTSESKKESVKVNPAAKDTSKVKVTENLAFQKTSNSNDSKNIAPDESVMSSKTLVSNDVIKADPIESAAVQPENGNNSNETDSTPKVQSEVCKSNFTKSKPKEVVQSKEESDDSKAKNNIETNAKAKSVWNPPQTPDSTKKVCKVEPSLMGLPCGLSITQRPALKTYPGLKPINTGKEGGIKGITGLSKEVSIKPIVSVSTSAAVLPNKTDVSCSSKISSSTTPIVPPSISKKPTPIRYKTLKSPTKPWNPSIPRSSMLMMKQNNVEKDPDQSKSPRIQPPKFFKTRNVPRYLGNPASGVKPMYQTSESSSANSETAKSKNLDLNSQRSCSSSVTLMKIDPKTLSPIAVSSAPSSPTPNPNFTVSSHLKKPSLPSPRSATSPKQTPILKSKPVVTNRTLAHSTSVPSPAHSRSLLSSNPFFNAANPLLYPGFPHPFVHAESTKRALAGATTSSHLIRAMSSLCSPTAAFHPSLPPSLSLLFNAHQVGFPRLNSSTNKAALKTLGAQEPSPPAPVSVSSRSSHTHVPSKPKKPATSPFLDSSRYGMLCTNGILPYPSEGQNSVSSSVESAFKSKSSSKPNCSVQRTDQNEKMDVNSSKREAKNIDSNKKTLINSNKRLKREDPIESNVSFKEETIIGSKKPTDGTEASPTAAKDSSCDIKSKPSSVSQPDKISENKSKFISNEVSYSSKQNDINSGNSNGNINENLCVSTKSSKSVVEKDSSVNNKDGPVIESNQCDNKIADFSNPSSRTSSKQIDKISETDVRLNAINNNNETSSNSSKDIPSLVSPDSIPQVN